MAQYASNLTGMNLGGYRSPYSAPRKKPQSSLAPGGGFVQQSARMGALDRMAGANTTMPRVGTLASTAVAGSGFATMPKVNTPEGAQQYIGRLREIEAERQRMYGGGQRPTVHTKLDEERDRLATALRLQGYARNDQGAWAKTGPRISRSGRMVNGRMVFEERPMTPAEEAAEAAKAARRGQRMGYPGF